MISGVLVVDKPIGLTSHDVVATARRALRVRSVGHTGTLDPQASGVLPLVVGPATRLASYLTASDKEYEAAIRFGVESDSYDAAGRVVRETGQAPARDALLAALERFRGAFDQTPPAFSAKKLEGDRAYALARQAKTVTLAPVRVVSHALELVEFDPPVARIRLVCSSGFYVRSLAHDLGRVLGCGAILDGLVRTRSGTFSLQDAVPFAQLAGGGNSVRAAIIPLERLLLDIPPVTLTAEGERRAGHGQDLRPADWVDAPAPDAQLIRLLSADGRLLGLAKPAKTPGFLHPAVVLR